MLTIGVGRINTAELAEQILEEDKVDMVVMGRAQLADPEFCNKAKAGLVEEIDYCVGCDQGCLDCFADVDCPQITCLRNPAVGREAECEINQAEKAETVLIAGGGIAGLEAAIVLQQRGHKAIVCEASDQVGGQFLTAGEAPRKGEMKASSGDGQKSRASWRGDPAEYSGYERADRRNQTPYGIQRNRRGSADPPDSGS